MSGGHPPPGGGTGARPHAGSAGAIRQPQGSSGFTALSPALETRRLVIAYGMQFHKDEALQGYTVDDYLRDNLTLSDDIEKVSATEYINYAQGVRFTIEETIKKSDFITYLKAPEIHLIYMGHARYGRGPCFGAHGEGDAPAPGQRRPLVLSEDWEQGRDADSGIFRMGYPYIGVPASEILEHGYTANLVKESEGRPRRADCDPELRPHLGSLHARTPAHILPGLEAKLRNHQEGDRYWVFGNREVIHHAGWRDTLSTPADLGALNPSDPDLTQMRCRVFSHLGCSTFVHNYPVVRKIANWRRAGNERYAFWTTAPSAPYAVGPWVHSLISYDKYNAFASWEPSLKFAVQRTQRSLRRLGARYRVI